jgi:phenylalanyl-tRNA synthetase beta chain
MFELNLEQLPALASRANQFEAIPEHPQVKYDISVFLDAVIPWARVRELVAASHELIRRVEFKEEYRGASVPPGKKSIMLRLLLGAEERTLSSSEIDAAASAAARSLTDVLGGSIRSGADTDLHGAR